MRPFTKVVYDERGYIKLCSPLSPREPCVNCGACSEDLHKPLVHHRLLRIQFALAAIEMSRLIDSTKDLLHDTLSKL